MESTQKILLNSSKNKKTKNENMSLNISFSGNKKLLPEDDIVGTLNSYEIYLNERKNSNKFRLVININPICTNILFNPFTEIVKNEGGGDVICLNYMSYYYEQNSIGKGKNFEWNQYHAIRDTQLSNNACGFEYHCGLDIFNNHILRNKTFKAVNFNENTSTIPIGYYSTAYGSNYSNVKVNTKGEEHVYLIEKDFNTIDDYMRDKDGIIVAEHFPRIVQKTDVRSNLESIILPLHLYQNYDISSFEECVENKLVEDNGWYGFNNTSTLGVTTLQNGTHAKNVVSTEFEIDTFNINCPTAPQTVEISALKISDKKEYDNESLGINKVINNKNYCDFIDMYPGRDLYSFTPKYNEHRKRIEKNWNYCLTYPSKNVIYNDNIEFPFFVIDNNNNTSLKIYMFDEGVVDDNGNNLLTLYTICQHGLVVGDYVNIYKSNTLFYESAEVIRVIDKYIFQVYKKSENMSEQWIEVEDRNLDGVAITNPFSYLNDDGETITKTPQTILKGVLRVQDSYYPICESNRCNVDPNAQNIHFRRVVNGVECKYYVRKFSRLPNFKFKDEEINDYTLYDDENLKNDKRNRRAGEKKLSLLKRFSNPSDESCFFESHISKLGFANTPYGDDVAEIVFTDSIDSSYIRDNLGRPLSDIYLTIVKNNKGYKEWYGIGKKEEIKSLNVEYSHCFGKVNSSFLFSEYYREFYQANGERTNLFDVRDITADNSRIRSLLTTGSDVVKSVTDEIEFDKDWEYYGDICCFSPVDCDEQVIQNAMHRFNTAQRELQKLNSDVFDYFDNGIMYHDEIYDVENTLLYSRSNEGDPYHNFKNGTNATRKRSEISPETTNFLFHTTKEEYSGMLNFQEGYYYQPHYRIPIKSVSRQLHIDSPTKYEVFSINDINDVTDKNRKLFEFKTVETNSFCKNDKLVLYRYSTNEYYFITVYNLLNLNTFTCVIADEDGNHIDNIKGLTDLNNVSDYVLLKKHYGTPDYAHLIKDGSCRFCWRDILSNGSEKGDKVYPFTNGAFYITKQINFYLRRQDPDKKRLGRITTFGQFDYVPKGENINNYFVIENNFESNEIEEC